MNLKLDKPIIFFDLETTGTIVKMDRIVQMAFVKIMPDGTKTSKTRLINPTIPIPPESTEIHGITDEMVKDEPTFAQIAKSLHTQIIQCDLSGYNILRFDIPVLQHEFKRCGIDFDVSDVRVLDVFNVYRHLHPSSLSAAYEKLLGKCMDNAHDALADVEATVEVMGALLEQYDIPNTVDEINATIAPKNDNRIDREGLFRWKSDEVIFAFGKFSGLSLKHVIDTDDNGYLDWFIRSDFNKEAKNIVKDARIGLWPSKPK